MPALRAGYLVAPPSLRHALRAARQLADGYGAPAEQAALARFLSDGLLARHLKRARPVYAERRELVLESVTALMGERLRLVDSAAGLHVAALMPDPAADDAALAAAAAAEGIAVEPLSAYSTGRPGPRGLVIGYGAVRTETIRPGLCRLARLMERPPDPRA